MSGITDRLNAALEGRYRIERELGAGGMATVYLAEDVKHHRKVALKVLRPELAAVVGAERFLAEIRTTANLQHPHILPLFDSGEADTFLFYVMPYVEGESLRETLDREKQLSVGEAVEIAGKVAGALHYAHEQGVVHRDIKPANILMSRGQPAVADFGIALALSEAGGGRITETGLSLGTPHYMSPEQASGDQSLDKRSDVYALGCILYEMLTGEPPFGGPTAQSVLAKILTGDPPRITATRRAVPPHVDAAVAKALEKLPADRFASADAFIRALGDEGFRHVSGETTGPGRRAASPSPRRRRALELAALVAAVALGLAGGFMLRPPAAPEPVFMATVEFPEDQAPVPTPVGASLALSPDGSLLVYAGASPDRGGWQLWVRRADALQATPLPGTTGAMTPTISPSGDAVAFVQGVELKVIGLGSGTSRTLSRDADLVTGWSADNYLYYIAAASNNFYRVAASGGDPELVPGLSPAEDRPPSAQPDWTWGDVLPGGRKGVWSRFPEGGDLSQRIIAVVDLETGDYTPIGRGSAPRYMDTGHLVWVSPEGTLLAAGFDARSGELTGEPVPVAENVRIDGTGAMQATLSQRGDLVYRIGGGRIGGMTPLWMDRSGDSTLVDPGWTVLPAAAGNWSGLALSPTGDRMVTTDGTGSGSQLWVKNLEDGTPPYRITFEGSFHVRPRWTPDGRSVTFISTLGGEDRPTQVWIKDADGSGAPRLLHAADVEIEEALISPDGEWLVYRQGGTTAGRDIYALRLGVDSVGRPLVATDADEKSPHLSPDGRWLAYMSDETGQLEVFVRPFPDVSAGRWQISRGGGGSPLWSRSGDRIFYFGREGGLSLTAAHLSLGESSLSVRSREAIFSISDQYVDQNYTAYDVAPGDERFLMYSYGFGERGTVIWVKNWLTEWRRRAGEGGG